MSNDTSKGPEDLTVMSREPLIAGTLLGSMKDLETPAANFLVRNHFPIPRLESSGWSLKVTGEVERPFSLGLDALKEMPRREVLVLMECAGNSRGSVQPPIEGLLGTMAPLVLLVGPEYRCGPCWNMQACWTAPWRCFWKERTGAISKAQPGKWVTR